MVFTTLPNSALQAGLPGLETAMLILSLMGGSIFYLTVIPLILWCYDSRLGSRLLILCSISTAVNASLKLLFHAPRPYWIDPGIRAFSSEPTFGMPSGAAQITLTFFGYIGAWFRKTPVWIICGILVVLTGISRMYLGVHFLIDVLTGWVFGLCILLVFLRYEDSAAEWLMHMPLSRRVLILFCISAGFILFSVAAVSLYGSWSVPPGWEMQAFAQTHASINPISMGDTLMAAGLVFGAAAGAVARAEFLPLSAGGTLSRKAIRYCLGIVILMILWLVLAYTTTLPGIAGSAMIYSRAACAGAWITAGAPYLFFRLGLSDTTELRLP